jgi:hypothetical protein
MKHEGLQEIPMPSCERTSYCKKTFLDMIEVQEYEGWKEN